MRVRLHLPHVALSPEAGSSLLLPRVELVVDTRVLSLRHLAGCVIAPLPEQIDATNAVRVQRDLIFLLTRGLGVLVADGSATTFCDVAGARALVRAAQASGGRPADFRLVAASPRLRRVLTLTGSDQILHLYPDLSSALPGKAEPAGNAGKPDRSGSRSLVTSALGRGGPSDRRRDRGARPPGAVPRLDTG
jgi:anti-anti-sigma factor